MDLQAIPDSWAATNLGSIVDYGKTQKCELADIDGVTWVVELEDIEKDTSRIISRGYTPARDFKSSKNLFNKGDILYGKLRPYLNKVVMADENGVCSTEIIPINAEPLVINKYIFYWIKSHHFLDYVNDVSYGVNMPRLGTNDGLNAPFILAPFAEQKEIVDRLDILLAQVEATQVRLARIPDIIKRFRQSVLTAAVSGKLTEEWRVKNNNLDIKSYINDIERSRKQAHEKENERLRANRNYKPPVIGETPSNIALPVGWALLSVDQIAAKITDGVHKKPNYISSGIPFVTVKNMTKGKGISFDDLNYISLEDHQEFCKRTNPKKGDILISKDGTLGVIRKVDVDFEFSIFVSVALVKPASYAMSDYLEIVFQSPFVQKQMVGVGTGLQHIHLTDLRKDMLPIPPSEEQAEIVRRVEQLFAYADNIEQQAKAAKERVDKLTQAILAKAFRGELTANWRAANPELISGDNGAAALLARIQAERAAVKPRKSRRV
ncbi:restriction endonuclease subunit S [Aeromonas caviae]